jgi:hypothetical protein
MTIESRPPYTQQMEQFNMELYENQRKNRLGDSIGDYLTDEDCDSRRIYEELLSEVDDWIKYHQRYLDKAVELKSLLMGNRSVTLEVSEFLSEDRWSNFPTENGDYISFSS